MGWEFLLLGLIGKGVNGYYSGKGTNQKGTFIGGKMSGAGAEQFAKDKKLAAAGDADAQKRMEAAAAKANAERLAGSGTKPANKNIDSSVLPPVGEKVGEGVSGAVYLTNRGTVLKKELEGERLKESERNTAKKAGELGIGPKVYYSDSKNIEMEDLVAQGGRSLDKINRPLNKSEFNDLVSQVDKMHKAGIYHKDLHEGNIFVMPNGKVKIIDFGSAGSNKLDQDQDYRAVKFHGEAGGHKIPNRIASVVQKSEDVAFDVEDFGF